MPQPARGEPCNDGAQRSEDAGAVAENIQNKANLDSTQVMNNQGITSQNATRRKAEQSHFAGPADGTRAVWQPPRMKDEGGRMKAEVHDGLHGVCLLLILPLISIRIAIPMPTVVVFKTGPRGSSRTRTRGSLPLLTCVGNSPMSRGKRGHGPILAVKIAVGARLAVQVVFEQCSGSSHWSLRTPLMRQAASESVENSSKRPARRSPCPTSSLRPLWVRGAGWLPASGSSWARSATAAREPAT